MGIAQIPRSKKQNPNKLQTSDFNLQKPPLTSEPALNEVERRRGLGMGIDFKAYLFFSTQSSTSSEECQC